MTNDKPKRLFIWLLILDSVLSVSITLIGQATTVGFDPIFYNPILIALTALIYTAVESYLPFLVLYKGVFEIVLKRGVKISPAALCGLLFVGLNVVSLTVAIASFGAGLNLIDVVVPVGLAVINVGIFYQRRVRGALSLRS